MLWLHRRKKKKVRTTKTTMLLITLLIFVTTISLINNVQYLYNIVVFGGETDFNNNNYNRELLLSAQQPAQAVSSSSTNHQEPKVTAAICMIIKSQLYDLDEWVDYHLALGFDTIFIYDNSDTYDLQLWIKSKRRRKLDSQKIYSRVQVEHHPGYRQQWSAYQKCIQSNKRSTSELDLLPPAEAMYMSLYKHDWLAFIDVDEFIVLKKHSTIQDLLADYKNNNKDGGPIDGLALNRITFYFDPITQLSHQPIPVTRKFQMRLTQPDEFVKTIAQTSQIKEPNIHFPKYKRGNFVNHIDTNFQHCTYVNEEDYHNKEKDNKLRQQQQQQDSNTTIASMADSSTVVGSLFDRPERNPTRPDDIAVIHHYETKSLEEFQSKCLRGRAASGKHPLACLPAEEIIKHFQSLTYNNNNSSSSGSGGGGLIFDDTAWQFLSNSLPDKYGIYN